MEVGMEVIPLQLRSRQSEEVCRQLPLHPLVLANARGGLKATKLKLHHLLWHVLEVVWAFGVDTNPGQANPPLLILLIHHH